MPIKTDNQLVQKIEKVIQEHREYRQALEAIVKHHYNGSPEDYAKWVLKKVKAKK